MTEIKTIKEAKNAIEAFGMKLLTVKEFKKIKKMPDGIYHRACEMIKAVKKDKEKADYVIYDPTDGSDGWVLVGEAIDITAQTLEYVGQAVTNQH